MPVETKNLPSRPKTGQKLRAHGEPMVWLTSMGLAVGLVMVVFLVGLIFVNGIEVFWPKRVAKLDLIAGESFAGEVAKKQQKNGSKEMEWQLYTGNKEVYGFSFKYFDRNQIKEVSQ